MKKQFVARFFSLMLVLAMVAGYAVPVKASGIRWKETDTQVSVDLSEREVRQIEEEPSHDPNEIVRVSIVMEDKPTVQMGYPVMGIAQNDAAVRYNDSLMAKQETMAQRISTQVLGGEQLDVVWNMTLVSNMISANVPYGKLDELKAMDGVKNVVLEKVYEPQQATKETAHPQMITSGNMIGSGPVWAQGYTGAGSRIAVIDTGTDLDHQSFDNGAYLYSLEQLAKEKQMSAEDYKKSLNLMDEAEIESVLDKLNVHEKNPSIKASDLYMNEKLSFGYNYVDNNLELTHDKDQMSAHGSHVAGISTANRYVPKDGSYVDAAEAVHMVGVAPDAQLITMKVFGAKGGAFESDYVAAIEDAILLGCDVVNLSLGTSSAGSPYSAEYEEAMSYLTKTDIVVSISAGNAGTWADSTTSHYLYSEDVSLDTAGSPGSYTNAFTVASVENAGTYGYSFEVDGKKVAYSEKNDYKNAPLRELDTKKTGTEYDYIFIEGIGEEKDYEGIELEGKIVFCSRGGSPFVEKANIAASKGAAAIVIYNNTFGPIGLDLTGYKHTKPCVAILKAAAAVVKEHSTQETTDGGVTYYTGKMVITSEESAVMHQGRYTMSEFSSWGVPGNLSMKPEITAPGGAIYSVEGQTQETDKYVHMSGTSMAAPQITGMTALAAQYFRETGIAEKLDISPRILAQSLFMSTADPLREDASGGNYYSILNQGSGLARIDDVVSAKSYIMVDGQPDGKVKAELGDDPQRTGEYSFSFTIHNMTDAAQDYALGADMFLQDVLTSEAGYEMLDKLTRNATCETSFLVDGKATSGNKLECDLNGDGKTDAQDADYLLEYLLGNETELKADGDVNGDGTVNTYDAHYLLAQLEFSRCVNVPANGEVQVEVTMKLSEETKEFLDEHNPNGGYVEAFVYVNGIADAEGMTGTQHSIPVLGYYGSWSEPSMFDKGSYAEYAYGMKQPSYLEAAHNNESNFLTISRGNDTEYYLAGNPVVRDNEYLQYRNAINTEKGHKIVNQYFSLIREAGDAKITVSDTKTGEVYKEIKAGDVNAAFFAAVNNAWIGAVQSAKVNWDGTDANGNKLPEGTSVDVTLAVALDYYRNQDGTYNYDALEDGAYYTTQVTIDNTAPKAIDIAVDETKANTLHVKAQDNQYLAAVALLNSAGNTILAAASPNQLEPGQEVEVELNLKDVRGKKFYVAVYDYAWNATTYEITLELEQPELPYFTVVDYSNVNSMGVTTYVGLESDGTGAIFDQPQKEMGGCPGKAAPRAAEYVDGYVFEVTENNELYLADEEDLYYFEYMSKLDPENKWMINNFNDLAYNPVDKTLYGHFFSKLNQMEKPYLCAIDMRMGTMEVLGEMPEKSHTLAIDDKGNFYTIDSDEGILYTFTLDQITAKEPTMTKVGDTGFYKIYNEPIVSSTAWDFNTGKLYWAYPTTLLEVDPATGECTVHNYYVHVNRMAGLYIRSNKMGNQFEPVEEIESVTVTPNNSNLIVGQKLSMRGQVWPWNVTDKSLTWESSDETLATVDENGVVNALKAGTVTITATSKFDPTKSGTATLKLEELDTKLNGLVWDNDGKVWWSEFAANDLTNYKKLCDTPAEQPLGSATMLPDGTIYAGTMDPNTLVSDLYKVDPKTFELTKVGGSSEIGYFDMTYAPNLFGGCLAVTYGPQLLFVDKNTGEMLNFIHMWYFDIVGVSYAYSVPYKDEVAGIDTMVDFFVIVDSHGYTYLFGYLVVDDEVRYVTDEALGAELGNMGMQSDTFFFNSLYFDGKYAYWAALNQGTNDVTMNVMDVTGGGRTYNMGTFGEGVWPVCGLLQMDAKAPTNERSDIGVNLTVREPENKEFQKVEIPEISADGSTNAVDEVMPYSGGMVRNDQITVKVTTPESATNGRVKVSYNPAEMTLVDTKGGAEAFASAATEGVVEVAYAMKDEVAMDSTVATLTFKPTEQAGDSVKVTVEHQEVNNSVSGVQEEMEIEVHHDCPTAHFEDVDQTKWYHEYVDAVYTNGYMKGFDATHFGPNANMTRAQVVTVLYRLAGSPAVDSTETFKDVRNDRWYTDAIAWAVENDIARGITEDCFKPNKAVTREQMATFFARYAKLNGVDVTTEGNLSEFVDGRSVSRYAMDAMAWACEAGLIEGMGNNTLRPQSNATRAQVAKVLMQYIALVSE